MKNIAIILFVAVASISTAFLSFFPNFQDNPRQALKAIQDSPASAPASSKQEKRTWKVDGVEREALLFLPQNSSVKSPVIFAFHGHGGTMRHAARTFGYQNLWPEAIVVYMQGLPTPGAITDPEGKKNGWQKTSGDQNDRDLKYFDAVLASLKKERAIDEKRIFATGHSNGGAFTFLLWAERGGTFAAFAPASATASWSMTKLRPKPAIQFGGESDKLVRYASQSRTMNYVRKLNGCEETGKEWAKSGALTGTLYPSKAGAPFVSLISPGGHQFPAEAPPLIVKFFKELPTERQL